MKLRVMLLLATTAVALIVASGVTLAQSQVRGEHNPPGLYTASEAARGAPPEEARLLRQLGQAEVHRHTQTSELNALAAPAGGVIGRPSGVASNASAESAARGYMAKYGPLFGIEDQKSELRTEKTKEAAEGKGNSVVRFRQLYKGVPVLAGELNVEVDGTNNLLVANGEVSPIISLDVEPEVGAQEAGETALEKIARDYDVTANRLKATTPELWIYDPRLLGGPGLGMPRLVWRMDVIPTRQPADLRELVLVDAKLGHVMLNFDQVDSALDRETYTANNTKTLPGTLVCDESNPMCSQGDPDATNAHIFAKDTYDFYSNHHARDSVDGQGMTLRSTIHFGQNFKNALWNGQQMLYGDGYPGADDVVGHEITHGVTERESHLFYYYQSGAINESFSDIWGEWIDQTNGKGDDSPSVRWLYGEDLPGVLASRNMKNPPAFWQPDKMTSPNYYTDTSQVDNGGVHTNSGVGNKAAYLLTDGDTFNGYTIKPLGIDTTAKIYYKVQTDMLLSGSDYWDLQFDLRKACEEVYPSQPDTGKLSFECRQVSKATKATEMEISPPKAPAIDAPVCSAGQTPTNLFFDDMENWSSGNWKATAPWLVPWAYYENYATSGTSSIHGTDPAFASDNPIEMTASVAVPNVKGTYLRFNHAYGFDDGAWDDPSTTYDGGVLEYSTTKNPNWMDAGPLFTGNSGYNGTISGDSGNPLAGRQAFVRESYGYRSSRVDLTSLAGQNVRFRFRIGSGSYLGDLGWFIDDVSVYTCA